jgi:hypothetical protein
MENPFSSKVPALSGQKEQQYHSYRLKCVGIVVLTSKYSELCHSYAADPGDNLSKKALVI